MTAIFTESEYEIELSAVQGPAGPAGYDNIDGGNASTEFSLIDGGTA